MGFGQQSGPPASAKQVAEITELLEQAGFASLREARHPFGLSQRQANGKFTRDEADDLIARVQAELDDGAPEVLAEVTPPDRPRSAPAKAPAPARPRSVPAKAPAGRSQREADRQDEVVAALPDAVLADELVRRGWMCMPPS